MNTAVIYASKTGFARKYAEWIADELRSGKTGGPTPSPRRADAVAANPVQVGASSANPYRTGGGSVDLFDAKSVRPDMLDAYDTIVYGGGLYAVGINGIKLIKDNLARLSGKKVVVFATGASPNRSGTTDFIRDSNFTVEEQKQIRFFYLRGGFDYSKLKPKDKILMTLLRLKIMMKKETGRIDDERGMLAVYKHPADFAGRKNIESLSEYLLKA